jgi:hypothetical protein
MNTITRRAFVHVNETAGRMAEDKLERAFKAALAPG